MLRGKADRCIPSNDASRLTFDVRLAVMRQRSLDGPTGVIPLRSDEKSQIGDSTQRATEAVRRVRIFKGIADGRVDGGARDWADRPRNSATLNRLIADDLHQTLEPTRPSGPPAALSGAFKPAVLSGHPLLGCVRSEPQSRP